MSLTVKKSSALAAAALAVGFAALPIQSAEARYYRNGWLAAGIVGGAILGGALLARPSYGHPVYGGPVYVDAPECYSVRRRVWDDYRGRWVMIRQRVCE
jgi:hypothetical protein